MSATSRLLIAMGPRVFRPFTTLVVATVLVMVLLTIGASDVSLFNATASARTRTG